MKYAFTTAIALLAWFSGICAFGAEGVEHIFNPDGPTIDAYRIYGLRIPLRVAKGDDVVVSYGAGNVWNPTAAFGDEQATLSEMPDSYRVYGADGVVRSGQIQVTHEVADGFEVTIGLNLFMLAGGGSAVDYMVSDRFIETFHDAVGFNDPFDRKDNAYDQAMIYYRDRDGKVRQYNRGEIFLGTFDIGAAKTIELFRSDRTLLTIKLGAYVGVPLNKINGWVAAGAAGHLAASQKLGHTTQVTAAAGGFVQDDQLLKIRDSLDFSDTPISGGYQGFLAVEQNLPRDFAISFGVEFTGQSAPLTALRSPGPNDARADHQARGTTTHQTYDAMVNFMHYLTAFIAVRTGGRNNSPTWIIYAREDYLLFPPNPYADAPINGGGNNPDFQMGMKVRVPFGP